MNDTNPAECRKSRALCVIVPSLFVALGLAVGGALVGDGVKNMRRADRFVTVKGLVERDVTADLAVWELKVKVAGNELLETQGELEANVAKVREFLLANGFTEAEISTRGLRVMDRKAQEYGEARADQMRYIVQAGVFLRSANVALVSKVSQMTSDLVKAGVALSDENSCNPGPVFMFTKLNEVKPEMLAEATKNARASAGQFAQDSGSTVGGIRQANQGIFSINSRDQANENNEGGGCAVSDPNKKIRVVTTIDYYLEH